MMPCPSSTSFAKGCVVHLNSLELASWSKVVLLMVLLTEKLLLAVLAMGGGIAVCVYQEGV